MVLFTIQNNIDFSIFAVSQLQVDASNDCQLLGIIFDCNLKWNIPTCKVLWVEMYISSLQFIFL